MSIIIGADIVSTTANKEYFISGNMQPVVGNELQNVLKKADYRIFNLECPLVNTESPIPKCGPNLGSEESTVKGLKSIGVDLLTLANNHIMDHGNAGLESTISVLEKENISFLGAGKNLEAAAKFFVFSVNNKKVGVYACVEHEFSVAGENKPGANPFDVLESFDHVANLKSACDYVIVLYHGGKEHYRYPSPMLQKVCRKFVEKGANLIVCQHGHCIGCQEKYLSSTIVYGQGNFIFNSCNKPVEQTSLLVEINNDMEISFIPLIKYGNGVRLADEVDSKKIMNDFFDRSEQIKDKEFIEAKYTEFAKERLNVYLLTCAGYGHKIWQRILNRLFGYKLSNFFAKRFYKQNELLSIQNFIECEAHRELWIEGLKKFN